MATGLSAERTSALSKAVLDLGPVRAPEGYWRAESGPALAALCLPTPQTAFGVQAFDRIITEQAQTNFAGETDGSVSAHFFGVNLAHALLLGRAGKYLDPATDARWQATVIGIAQRLLTSGEAEFWVNGNVVVGRACLLAYCYAITLDTAWLNRAAVVLKLAVAPDPALWPRCGLMTRTTPDGVAGYFTETPNRVDWGYDADYSSTHTLSMLARMHMVSGSRTDAPRLLGIAWRWLVPMIDAAGTVDVAPGIRHPHAPGTRWIVESCAVPWMAKLGDAKARAILPAWKAHCLDPARMSPTMGAAATYGVSDVGLGLLNL